MRAIFLRELFLRVLARPAVRFLAVRPLLAALRFGAFLFLAAALALGLAAGFLFALARAGFRGAGAADGCGLG